MAKPGLDRTGATINRARSRYEKPESNLHRSVKTALSKLDASRKKLLKKVVDRQLLRTARKKKEAAVATQSLYAAATQLKQMREILKQSRSFGNPQLVQIAENQLDFAQRHYEMMQKSVTQPTSLINIEQVGDQIMLNWINSVMERTVEALDSDAAADAAVGLFSSGLIAAGLVGGPAVILGAAAASAALVANDMRNRLSVRRKIASEGKAIARVETALILIQCVTNVSDQWLAII